MGIIGIPCLDRRYSRNINRVLFDIQFGSPPLPFEGQSFMGCAMLYRTAKANQE